jgi:hypothetical protein
MQAAYLTPAAVPTVIDMLAPVPAPPGGNANALEPPRAPPTAPFEVVVPRLATDGGFEPPPQPAASITTLGRAPANTAKRAFEPSIIAKASARAYGIRPFDAHALVFHPGGWVSPARAWAAAAAAHGRSILRSWCLNVVDVRLSGTQDGAGTVIK